MKIDYLNIAIYPDSLVESGGSILEITVQTDKKKYELQKILPQDDFRSLYDRLIDCSKQILQTIEKETNEPRR